MFLYILILNGQANIQDFWNEMDKKLKSTKLSKWLLPLQMYLYVVTNISVDNSTVHNPSRAHICILQKSFCQTHDPGLCICMLLYSLLFLLLWKAKPCVIEFCCRFFCSWNQRFDRPNFTNLCFWLIWSKKECTGSTVFWRSFL